MGKKKGEGDTAFGRGPPQTALTSDTLPADGSGKPKPEQHTGLEPVTKESYSFASSQPATAD